MKDCLELHPFPVLYRVSEHLKKQSISRYSKGLTGIKDGVRYKWLTPEHKFIQMIVPNKRPVITIFGIPYPGYLTPYLEIFPEKRF